MAKTLEDVRRETAGLSDRKLAERHSVATSNCVDWSARAAVAKDDETFWSFVLGPLSFLVLGDSQADADAAGGWCELAELYRVELERRRAESPERRRQVDEAQAQVGKEKREQLAKKTEQAKQEAAEEEAAEARETHWWNPFDWPELLGSAAAAAAGLDGAAGAGEIAASILGLVLLAGALGLGGWLLVEAVEWGLGLTSRNVQTFAPVVRGLL